jgi:hypothetical protein
VIYAGRVAAIRLGATTVRVQQSKIEVLLDGGLSLRLEIA